MSSFGHGSVFPWSALYIDWVLFFFLLNDTWDLSCSTKDRTHAPCSGSVESQPLYHQGSPMNFGWHQMEGQYRLVVLSIS